MKWHRIIESTKKFIDFFFLCAPLKRWNAFGHHGMAEQSRTIAHFLRSNVTRHYPVDNRPTATIQHIEKYASSWLVLHFLLFCCTEHMVRAMSGSNWLTYTMEEEERERGRDKTKLSDSKPISHYTSVCECCVVCQSVEVEWLISCEWAHIRTGTKKERKNRFWYDFSLHTRTHTHTRIHIWHNMMDVRRHRPFYSPSLVIQLFWQRTVTENGQRI